jgi:hypothetical protein
VSAETPQPATAETSQPTAQDGAKGQPAGNQQLRIIVLVVVAALVGIGLWLAFGNSSKGGKGHGGQGVAPIAQSARQLKNRVATTGQRIYWIGPKKNYHYEYTRTPKGLTYIRYLPKGVPAGGKPGKLLIIGTYPMSDAYHRLKKGAKGRVAVGKHGSIVWVSSDPKSVYIAWKGVPYEVEVDNQNASNAARIAESGQVIKVGG